MWFQLSLSYYSAPLGAVVGVDGHLYWRVVDVGHFLGHTNPYTFAKKLTSDAKLGEDVLPPEDLPVNTLKALLIPTRVAQTILEQSRAGLGHTFQWLLEHGIAHIDGWPHFQDSVKGSPHLRVVDTPDMKSVSIPGWIHVFTSNVQHLRRFQHSVPKTTFGIEPACLIQPIQPPAAIQQEPYPIKEEPMKVEPYPIKQEPNPLQPSKVQSPKAIPPSKVVQPIQMEKASEAAPKPRPGDLVVKFHTIPDRIWILQTPETPAAVFVVRS